MKPDEPGLVLFLKMTVDRVSHHLTQFFEGFALRKDGIPQRSRRVASFGSVFHCKDNLLVSHSRNPSSSR